MILDLASSMASQVSKQEIVYNPAGCYSVSGKKRSITDIMFQIQGLVPEGGYDSDRSDRQAL